MCTLEKRGRVYLLTITGPGEHRLNPDLLSSIRSALSRVRSDSSPSSAAALVIAAEGKFFSNGFDLAWARISPSDRAPLMSSALVDTIADILSLPMPTVAAITGHAAAAGFALALAFDYRVMRSDRGFLYMSELDIGLPIPRYFMTVMRAKVRDPRALRRVLLQAGRLTAKEAAGMGLVDVVADGGVEGAVEEAVRMGEELAGRGWDGGVYGEIRAAAFKELSEAVELGRGKAAAEDEALKEIRSRL